MAYRLAAANESSCTDAEMMSGMLLHDLSQYDPAMRASISRAFSLGSGVGVIELVPGSPAEQAGLRIDDEIIAIAGQSLEDRDAVAMPRRSSKRLDRVSSVMQAALQRGSADLLVRRAGATFRVALKGQRGCGGQLSLVQSGERNAWADGRHVVVTTAMTDLARTDDEIAFVIAHEMAHNILGHSRETRSSEGIFGFGRNIARVRSGELDADQLAVRLMSNAGYRSEGGISFLRNASRKLWWAVSLDHPGFSRRIQAVAAARAALPPATAPSLNRPLTQPIRLAAISAPAQPASASLGLDLPSYKGEQQFALLTSSRWAAGGARSQMSCER